MTGCLISAIYPLPNPRDYTIVPICPPCINSSSWNSVLPSIRSQNHQQAWRWFWLSAGPSQSEPCLDDNHIIPTQEHRQREKYSNQYCTLTSVWPLKFLPTRHFPPQLKEDIQQMFISGSMWGEGGRGGKKGKKKAETDLFAARMRSNGIRFQSVTANTVTAVPVLRHLKYSLCQNNKQTGKKNGLFNENISLFISLLYVTAEQRFICVVTAWQQLCQLSARQSEWSSTHQRHLSSHPSPSPLSCLSVRFTLTNVREQAAPADLWEAGRGAMDRGKLDLIAKCQRITLLVFLFSLSHFVCACVCVRVCVCVQAGWPSTCGFVWKDCWVGLFFFFFFLSYHSDSSSQQHINV